jgi:hypothetical protein
MGDQLQPQVVPVGDGGVLIAWTDERGGTSDVYAQRFTQSGFVSDGWPANGVVVCSAAGAQINIAVASDGGDGMFIAWQDPRSGDDDVYVQHIRKDGAVAPGWPVDGQRYGDTAGNQQTPVLAADGTRGVYLAWSDSRGGNYDIYALRLDSDGGILSAPQSGAFQAQAPPFGHLVCGAAGDQKAPRVMFDGSDHAIVVWEDQRAGAVPDIYGMSIDKFAVAQPSWTADGVLLSDPATNDLRPRLTHDGGKGAIVAWCATDVGKVEARHLDEFGVADWGAPGVPVVVSAGVVATQGTPIVPDGLGGAFIAFGITGYAAVGAQHLTASGTPASGWGTFGLVLSPQLSGQIAESMLPDGAGGIYLSYRSGDDYVLRVAGDGSAIAGWPFGGVTEGNGSGGKRLTQMVSDGAGGVIAVWEDSRTSGLPGSTARDIYAQRLLPMGLHGDYATTLATVADVPADQGGWVRLSVAAPLADSSMNAPYVTGYGVWRLVTPEPPTAPAALSPAASADARALVAGVASVPAVLRPAQAAAMGFPPGTWASLGFYPATQSSTYLLDAPTRNDSTATGDAAETYVVTMHTTVPFQYVVTGALTSHSVDNIAPLAPQNLAGSMVSGAVNLAWSANGEGDLAGYSVYRGAGAAFVPSPANRVGTPATPALVDGGFTVGDYYKVAARDRHGNESPYAVLGSAQIAAVEGGTAAADFFAPLSPNPFSRATEVAFGLARAGRASVTVLDLAGRRVRTLLEGDRPAGPQHLSWNGADDSGRALPPGLYLVRVRVPGAQIVRRVVRVE